MKRRQDLARLLEGRGRSVGALLMRLYPFKLPRRKAPQMDVELVQSWRVAIMGELDLEFQLVLRHGELADRAGSPDPRPTPCTVWLA
jgi:hypothetical protein